MKRISWLFTLVMNLSILQAHEQFIHTSDSVSLYVNVKGQGPACLYIHGGPGSGSYWLEKFLGDSLETKYQMIYLDQRGVGRSSSPKDQNYSLERMVRDFEEVRAALGIRNWITLGHSFGGILQMEYVLQNPGVISGMVFINYTLDMNDSFGNSWLPKAIELLGKDVPAEALDTTLSVYDRMMALMPVLGGKGEMWKIFFQKEENSWKLNDSYSNFTRWNSDQSEKILEFDEYWTDFRTYTSEIKQSVLFYYGKKDWAIGPEHYKGINFPNMILYGSEVGHMPFLENREDLWRAINQYSEVKQKEAD